MSMYVTTNTTLCIFDSLSSENGGYTSPSITARMKIAPVHSARDESDLESERNRYMYILNINGFLGIKPVIPMHCIFVKMQWFNP